MKQVELTMTIEQAEVVKKALDFYSRIGIGQIEEVQAVLRDQMGFDFEAYITPVQKIEWDQIRRSLHAVKAFLGFDRNASYGIGNQNVSINVHRSYEVFKVLCKTLIEDRDPNPGFKGVHYDGLTVRYTQDPEPKAIITGE